MRPRRPRPQWPVDSALTIAVLGLCTIARAAALSCYICGDANLGEFGECAAQFEYDCSTYARRFPAAERVYCRTTRHRAPNNTYTVMKECISERDHHRTFPRKAYPLDEECDLLDVDGQEVAYCLCRHNQLCNRRSIAEQFLAFEEKHPELFAEDGPVEERQSADVAKPPSEPLNTLQRKQSVIVPVNGVKTNAGASAWPLVASSSPTATNTFSRPQLPSIGDEPAAPSPPHAKKLPSASTGTSSTGQNLHCMQCGEAQLKDRHADCLHQVSVDCGGPAGEYVCYTRQLLLGQNENGVEKMCVAASALSESDLGVKGGKNTGCARSGNDDAVRFCVCATDECNRAPIETQMVENGLALEGGQDVQSMTPIVPVREVPKASAPQSPAAAAAPSPPNPDALLCLICSQSSLRNSTVDCADAFPIDCSAQMHAGQTPYCLTRQTQMANGMFAVEKRCVSGADFRATFPSEIGLDADIARLPTGCAAALQGRLNYCLCNTSRCNDPSVIEQATSFGLMPTSESRVVVESTREPIRPVVVSSSGSGNKNHHVKPKVIEASDDEDADILVTQEAATSHRDRNPHQSTAELELLERQRAWRQRADEAMENTEDSGSAVCVVSMGVLLVATSALALVQPY